MYVCVCACVLGMRASVRMFLCVYVEGGGERSVIL